jgi:sec-independent protein translocase protein TatC
LEHWRFAILFIAIFAAVITPSQDPYTMLGMMLPMIIFYWLAILVIKLLKR